MLAAKLCTGIALIVAVVTSYFPVSTQATEPADWCPDDSTSTIQLPSGVTCNLCPPGTYMTQDCTADNPNPQCAACTATRHYNPCYNNAYRCKTCSDCSPILSGLADGRDGMVDGEECTPTRDRVCTCPSNSYWDFQTAGCKNKTACDEGYGVAHIATYKSDTVCIECVDGTFSDEKSLTQQCQSCTDCGGGTTVQPCTTAQDSRCDFGPAVPHTGSTIAAVSATRSAPQVPVSNSVMGTTKMNIDAIIGGSVGGCLLFVLFAGCLWWRCRGRKHTDYTGIEMQNQQEPGPAPRVSSRPATRPSTPEPDSWTFPKKFSEDGLCSPQRDTQDPGPPNNAHDVYEKEANYPLQPIPLHPEDLAGPAGGRLEPVGSSCDDLSVRSPVQNV